MSVSHNARVKLETPDFTLDSISKSKMRVCGGGGRGNINRRHNMGFL